MSKLREFKCMYDPETGELTYGHRHGCTDGFEYVHVIEYSAYEDMHELWDEMKALADESFLNGVRQTKSELEFLEKQLAIEQDCYKKLLKKYDDTSELETIKVLQKERDELVLDLAHCGGQTKALRKERDEYRAALVNIIAMQKSSKDRAEAKMAREVLAKYPNSLAKASSNKESK